MAQDLIKLKSINERGFFSRGNAIELNQVFEDAPGNAKYLIGRGLAELYREEQEQSAEEIEEKVLTTENTPVVAKKKTKKAKS